MTTARWLTLTLALCLGSSPALAEVGVPLGAEEKAPRLHLALDVDPVAAYSLVMGFGAQLHLNRVFASLWNTRLTTGTFEVGALVGYEFEPNAQLAGYLAGAYTGGNHRLALLLSGGSTLYVGASRRFSFGFFVFAGYVNYTISGTLKDPAHDIDRTFTQSHGAFDSGGLVKLGFRLTDRLGLNLFVAAPFPYNPYPVPGIVRLGLGLTVWLQ